jgi:hypothetical protein
MRKLVASVLVAVFGISLLSGCAMVKAPVSGTWYTDLKAPEGVTSNAVSTKVGTGECVSILGLVATGDASIDAIARRAGITKIHHVDYEAFSVLGLYAKYTVFVHGE